MSYPSYDPRTRHDGPSPGDGRLRPLLWVLLVIGLAGNVVTAAAGLNVAVGSAFGLLVVGSGVTLIVQHYRNRRR